MRVIAGKAKGRSLRYLKDPHTRPTTDRVREAIFSSLESSTANWDQVLDLYAGTGALGIEALSRGTEEVDFVDKNPKCCAIIKENLISTNFFENANIYQLEASKALQKLTKIYNLIFLDPPYSEKAYHQLLIKLVSSNLVGEKTTIVLEHSQKTQPDSVYGNFMMTRSLHHGDTYVSIFQQEVSRN